MSAPQLGKQNQGSLPVIPSFTLPTMVRTPTARRTPASPVSPESVRGPRTPEQTPKKGTQITFFHIENGEKTELKGTVQGRRKNQHGVFELKVGYTYLGKKNSTWISKRQHESVAATVLHMRPLRKKTPHMNATIIQRAFREWYQHEKAYEHFLAAVRLQSMWRTRVMHQKEITKRHKREAERKRERKKRLHLLAAGAVALAAVLVSIILRTDWFEKMFSRLSTAEVLAASTTRKKEAPAPAPVPVRKRPVAPPSSSSWWGGTPSSKDELRPSEALHGNCYGFPAMDFAEGNSAAHDVDDGAPRLSAGDSAIDFSLVSVRSTAETEGLVGNQTSDTSTEQIVTLSELLRSRPVVLVYGMYSDPVFHATKTISHERARGQGRVHVAQSSATLAEVSMASFTKFDEHALVERYKDEVTFVHVYTVEPHPRAPDAAFYSGRVEEAPWSDAPNPRTFNRRLQQAERIRKDLHPFAHLVVDQLDGAPPITGMDGDYQINNPLWCSYGRNSRSAFLISQEGKVVESQEWFHATTMADAIEALLLQQQITDLKRGLKTWEVHLHAYDAKVHLNTPPSVLKHREQHENRESLERAAAASDDQQRRAAGFGLTDHLATASEISGILRSANGIYMGTAVTQQLQQRGQPPPDPWQLGIVAGTSALTVLMLQWLYATCFGSAARRRRERVKVERAVLRAEQAITSVQSNGHAQTNGTGIARTAAGVKPDDEEEGTAPAASTNGPGALR